MVLFTSGIGLTVKRGYSFAECFGRRADAAFTGVMRKWFGAMRNRRAG
jgi:hypothetical protein